MKITSTVVLSLSLMGCPAFADGVYIAPPTGGYSDPADPLDGIKFGSSYYIAPGAAGLTYSASENFFTGSISLVGPGGGLATLSRGSSTGDLDIYVSEGINTQWLTLQVSNYEPHLRLGWSVAPEIEFGSGLAAPDTVLARSASGVLQVNGQTIVTQNSLGNYVTLTGAQTLSGNKTFSGMTTLGGASSANQTVVDASGKLAIGGTPLGTAGKFSVITSSQTGRQVVMGDGDGTNTLLTVRGDDNGISRVNFQNLSPSASIGHGFGLWTYFGTNPATTPSPTPVWAGSLNVVKETEWVSPGTSTHNSAMTFATAAAGSVAERMRISSAGNVGVGTTTPLAKLHIHNSSLGGTSNFFYDNVYASQIIASTDSRVQLVSSNAGMAGSGFILSNAPALGANTHWSINHVGSAIGDGLLFRHSTTSANGDVYIAPGFVNALYLSETGNVGVGTTAPSEKLEVNGNVKVTNGTLTVNGAPVATTSTAQAWSGAQTFNSTTRFTTSSPTTNPDFVIGNDTGLGLFLTAWGSNHGGTRFGVSRNNMSLIEGQGSGPLVLGTNGAAAQPVIFGTNGAERMRIDATGNVGIGTTAPVAYSAARKALVISDTTNDVTLRLLGSNNTDLELVTNGVGGALVTRSNHPITFNTNNLERMKIMESGNIGIGTATPAAKLDVNGTIQVAGNVTIKNVGATKSVIRISPAGDLGMGEFTAGTNPNPEL